MPQSSGSPDKINFGGSVSTGMSEPTPCPDDQDFCDDAEDFPTVTTSYGRFNNANKLNRVNVTKFSIRVRGDLPEARACQVQKSKIHPRKARDVSGSFRFILNSEEYVQSLEIEECIGDGLPCAVDSDAPAGGSTFCRQQYSVYQLLSLDPASGKDVAGSFRLPSACICHHTHLKSGSENIGLLELRLALRREPEQNASAIADTDPDVTTEESSINVEEAQTTTTTIKPSSEKPVKKSPNKNSSRIFFGDSASENQPSVGPSAGPSRPSVLQRLKSRGSCGNGESSSNGYCETSSYYPEELINSLVQFKRNFPLRIKKKLLQEGADLFELDIQTRFNINEQQLCQGWKRIIVPKEAKNLADEWKYVINSQNYTQSVNIEECVSNIKPNKRDENTEFGSCLYSGVQGLHPTGTVCKQLYREHRLMIISEKGELEIDSFRLPSACACHLRGSSEWTTK